MTFSDTYTFIHYRTALAANIMQSYQNTSFFVQPITKQTNKRLNQNQQHSFSNSCSGPAPVLYCVNRHHHQATREQEEQNTVKHSSHRNTCPNTQEGQNCGSTKQSALGFSPSSLQIHQNSRPVIHSFPQTTPLLLRQFQLISIERSTVKNI